jgi:hypothetical protein
MCCIAYQTEDEVKLLGVTIDYELKFNSHITNICRKASRQLNVLKMINFKSTCIYLKKKRRKII